MGRRHRGGQAVLLEGEEPDQQLEEEGIGAPGLSDPSSKLNPLLLPHHSAHRLTQCRAGENLAWKIKYSGI